MSKVTSRALLCGIAGFLAWLVTEPFAPRFIPTDPTKNFDGSQGWLILLIGGLVGGMAGFLQGNSSGSRRQTIEATLLGLIFGAIGSTFGAGIGGLVASLIMKTTPGEIAYMEMPGRMIARVLALMPIGLFMGLAIGATLKSRRGVVSGLIGGAMGGIIVGFAFDALAGVLANFMATTSGIQPPPGYVAEIGGPSRAILATGLGVAVGLFCAIVDQATRQAWVRLVLGRNEGKEWPIDNPQTTIGRDERANVPLFGDMSVAPLHAIIFNDRGSYKLQDQNTSIGVGYNNQRVSEIALNPGDYFQVGGHTLQFLMKDSAARQMQESRAQAVMTNAAQNFNPIQQPYIAPGGPNVGGTVSTGNPPSNQQGLVRALIATNGPLAGQRFDLSVITEAGRESPGINLAFDQQASRRHATFTPQGSVISVQDLGSTNGTIVNGIKVTSAFLKQGDTVQFGNTIFRVE